MFAYCKMYIQGLISVQSVQNGPHNWKMSFDPQIDKLVKQKLKTTQCKNYIPWQVRTYTVKMASCKVQVASTDTVFYVSRLWSRLPLILEI